MSAAPVVTDTGAVFLVLFAVVLLGPLLARRVRLPEIVGLIVAGTLIGEHVGHIVPPGGILSSLGHVGLLYLMFQAGLDLDLSGFRRRRRDAVLFGAATTLLPLAGIVAAGRLLLGLGWAATLMLAAAFASHTLLSLPAVIAARATRARAVTAALGATLIVTGAALALLAAVAASVSSGGAYGTLRLVAGLPALVALFLVVVPVVIRWFFARVSQSREVRMTFVLAGMLAGSVLAAAVGSEPIIGAFLAGLAFNRHVPSGTGLSDRISYIGTGLFVPAFLVHTGTLLDPAALVSPRVLQLGAVLAAVTLTTKWAAAETAGRLCGFERAERQVMFGLSAGQAAGALAAAVVAQRLGLVGADEVNATVLVILVTAFVAGTVTARGLAGLPAGDESGVLGSNVLVPVANPDTAGPLARLAAAVALEDGGRVTVAAVETDARAVDGAGSLVPADVVAAAEREVLAAGAETVGLVRCDATVISGITFTARETAASCLVVGWKGYTGSASAMFGSVIDALADVPLPKVLYHPAGTKPDRVVLVIAAGQLHHGASSGAQLASQVACRASRHLDLPLAVVTDAAGSELDHVRGLLPARTVEFVRVERVGGALQGQTGPRDLVVAGVPDAAGSSVASPFGRMTRLRLSRLARDRHVVVAIP